LFRQPCSWDITLDCLLEPEIELEEKPKLDHSFVSYESLAIYSSISKNLRFENDFLL